MPCSDGAVYFVRVRVGARNIRTASPAVQPFYAERLFCSVLLSLFTVVIMDREEVVMIAYGLYLLSEEEKRKNYNTV
jgi:hypothetical protein